METLQSHFHQWGAVLFFTVIYSVALLFVPFYKKMDRKPATAYFAFILAFAIEMHGIPMSMYLISWIIGRELLEGVLWGHTLFSQIGYGGCFDKILLHFSLHDFPAKYRLSIINQLAENLKPSGSLFIREPLSAGHGVEVHELINLLEHIGKLSYEYEMVKSRFVGEYVDIAAKFNIIHR